MICGLSVMHSKDRSSARCLLTRLSGRDLAHVLRVLICDHVITVRIHRQ